jgi:choline-sulfatase
MKKTNVLFLMADEHSSRVLGCYGNPVIRTPNLDGLAAAGTRFTSAYTPCPICVPARGALQTGRHVHEIGSWCNGTPYHGQIRGWGHRLIDLGHRVVSVGKLHLRSSDDSNGFDEEILPMHVLDGIGDLHGMVRNPPPQRPGIRLLAEKVQAGESSYTVYDTQITERACEWIRTTGPGTEKPWVLFVSFVRPHFPLIAPERFMQHYLKADLPRPFGSVPDHPVMKELRRIQNYDDYFVDDDHRRLAIAAYYGMVNAVDEDIGRVLDALRDSGQADDTLVIYTSDHGDNLGNRGFWGKSNMYEDSAGVPMILAGPGMPRGGVVDTPVTLLDLPQTIIEAVGEHLTGEERADLPGRSLFGIAGGDHTDRAVLSEYHAVAAITGIFMIRYRKWKLVYFVGYPAQLFDLEADPLEQNDLGQAPGFADVRRMLEQKLRAICDPEAVSERAFRDQAAMIERHGGTDAIFRRGEFPHTPVPGEAPIMGT